MNTSSCRFFRIASLVSVLSMVNLASANVVFSGDPNQSGGSVATLDFTSPIDFTVIGTGSVSLILFKDWVISDGTQTSRPLFGTLSYSINSGATRSLAIQTVYDNAALSAGDSLRPGDGYIFISTPVAVTGGDVFRLLAASLTVSNFGGNTDFNPLAVQTFTGDLMLASSGGTGLSLPASAGAIPEPAAAAVISGLGALGLVAGRRRPRALNS